MHILMRVSEVKKIFLLVVILVFMTGCSPAKLLLGPIDEGDDIDYDGEMDDISTDLEHENNMRDDDGGDIDYDGEMDDISTDLEHENNMRDDDGGDIDYDGEMDDISTDLEHENNMRDDRGGGDDIDFDSEMDNITTDLEHENNMRDDDDGDIDYDGEMDNISADLEHEANMRDDDSGDSETIEEEPEDKEEERRGGSCNAITKTSTCIDYIGPFWTETQMRYSCSYSGEFSFEPCEGGNIGGCEVGRGSFNDMIIWMYPYGGSPIAADTAKSAKPSCDMNPMGNWLSAR